MPSDTHQWLTVWLGRRLRGEGFKLIGADAGVFASFLEYQLPSSITLAGIRPDVIGIHTKYRNLAVGEAKTSHDIPREHTMIQLAAMLAMKDNRGRQARVYLAFPHSAMQVAAKTVLTFGLKAALNIVLVPIPDALLSGRCG